MKKNNIALLFVVFVFLLNTIPGILKGFSAFTYDNGRDMIKAYEILYEGKLTLIGPTTGIPGVFHGAWAFYWLAIPFILWSGNPIGVALSVAFLNLAGVIFFYKFITKRVGLTAGFLASLFYASSTHILAHSVQLSHNNLLPFLVSLSLFLLSKYFFLKSKKYLFLFGLCISFLFEFEFGGGLFIFLFNLMFICVYLLLRLKSAREKIINFFLFFVAIIIPILPRLAFEFRHGFMMTRNLFLNFVHPEIRYYFFKNLSFQDRLFDRAKTFYNLWVSAFSGAFSFLEPVFLILTVVGAIFLFRKIKKENLLFLTYLSLLIAFVISGWIYYKDAVWTTYTSGFPVYFLAVFAFVLNFFFKTRVWKRLFLDKIIVFSFAIVILYSSIWQNVIMSKSKVDDPSAISNQQAAISYIYSKEKNNNFAVGVYSPSWFSYPYDYWFLWREKFYGIKRPKSLWTAKINYLIREPGSGNVTEKQWFEKFMNKKAKFVSRVYFGKLKVEKWKL